MSRFFASWRSLSVVLAVVAGLIAQVVAEQHLGPARLPFDPRWAIPLFAVGGLLLSLSSDQDSL